MEGVDEDLLSVEAAQWLLHDLCSLHGYCSGSDRLGQSPPQDIDEFTDAVLVEEGFDPPAYYGDVRTQVRAVVAEAFKQYQASKLTPKFPF